MRCMWLRPLTHRIGARCVACTMDVHGRAAMRLERRAEVQQQFADGGVGDTAERRRNRERRKAHLAQLDARLAPIVELLGRLRGVDPPDYGSFDVRQALVDTAA